MKINLRNLNNNDLWNLYGKISKELKEREQIRTKNITAERGEKLAIDHYNNTKGLPNLQAAPTGTKNIDAISRLGERYAIKTMTLPNKTTGVFWGLGTPKKPINERKFEYVIVVIINQMYGLEKIIEINWNDFLKIKKWHSTMKSFNISINKDTLSKSKIIYEKE